MTELDKQVAEIMCNKFGSLALEADETRYIQEILGHHQEAALQNQLFLKYQALNAMMAPADWEFCGFRRVEDFGPRNAIRLLDRALRTYEGHHRLIWEREVQVEAWNLQQEVRLTAAPIPGEEGAVTRVREGNNNAGV